MTVYKVYFKKKKENTWQIDLITSNEEYASKHAQSLRNDGFFSTVSIEEPYLYQTDNDQCTVEYSDIKDNTEMKFSAVVNSKKQAKDLELLLNRAGYEKVRVVYGNKEYCCQDEDVVPFTSSEEAELLGSILKYRILKETFDFSLIPDGVVTENTIKNFSRIIDDEGVINKLKLKHAYESIYSKDYRNMSYNELAEELYKTHVDNGWANTNTTLLENLALIHSEISEAVEECRKNNDVVYFDEVTGKPEGLAIELIDVLTRTMNVLYSLEFPVPAHLLIKNAYNKTRGKLHGKIK